MIPVATRIPGATAAMWARYGDRLVVTELRPEEVLAAHHHLEPELVGRFDELSMFRDLLLGWRGRVVDRSQEQPGLQRRASVRAHGTGRDGPQHRPAASPDQPRINAYYAHSLRQAQPHPATVRAPSTTMFSPFTKPDSSARRYAQSAPISAGVPRRPA